MSPADLDAPLAALRDSQRPDQALDAPLGPGLLLHRDPAGEMTGCWRSPRGRLLELETGVTRPGGWLALHVALPLPDLAGLAWLGLACRTAAQGALTVRVALRSGLPEGGFRDLFFDRQILSQAAETDHHDLIAPDRQPDLPLLAPWREIILFLPPGRDIRWALHDLRLIAL